MNYQNIIFDLDGTLVDSIPGISQSLRHAVSVVDDSLPLPELTPFIGPPLPAMLSRIWPDLDAETISSLILEFRGDYNERGCLSSKPYAGVPVLLKRLQQLGKKQFILTNKPLTPTMKILRHHGLAGYFEEVVSPDSTTPMLLSKAAGGFLLVARHGLVASSTLLIGDSNDDFLASKAVGFDFMEASYGYGEINEKVEGKEWLRLDTPSDLVKILETSIHL